MYTLDVEYAREVLLGEDAPKDQKMISDDLHALLNKMGLEVERRGGVVGASCRICGPVIGKAAGQSSKTQAHCDPEKHDAYYTALEGRG